jgi:hypothetical protein
VPKTTFCNFCKSVRHEDKDCRTLEIMKERKSDTYRVQVELMIVQPTQQPQYNNACNNLQCNDSIIMHNSLEHHHSITMQKSLQFHRSILICSHSTIRHHSIIHHMEIIKEIEEGIMDEEDLEGVADQ